MISLLLGKHTEGGVCGACEGGVCHVYDTAKLFSFPPQQMLESSISCTHLLTLGIGRLFQFESCLWMCCGINSII